jgi:pimeloyl-ACP methyl ester carboxylesterase
MWRDVPTRTIKARGVRFAYRELGPSSGVPLVFLHHFTAVLDDWDPRVVDGIARQATRDRIRQPRHRRVGRIGAAHDR